MAMGYHGQAMQNTEVIVYRRRPSPGAGAIIALGDGHAGLVQRLRALRKIGDVSLLEQDRLAQLARGHSQAIDCGRKRNLSARTLLSLATVYGVSMDYLYRGVGPRPSDGSVVMAIDVADDRVLLCDLEVQAVRKKYKRS